ncbi:GNAT family N-acetyltransferase [Oscillatoria sp. FACHB-1406]|uniref:GNAT family N-acetyltransferase n=1 Tax=Oscillatoria sp. FACHB-1406 TaxID=2692846 RepID=UPI001684A09A|nr:GNAT family N-acetyltransferase [Oscillatoria sp. FACHB-1406]MBD2577962.1 GNAT family N-acetyltransferase [Oscillatoria sp. FACHB-1406]
MNLSIRPLQANELETADKIFRIAFGTFMGLPNPADFLGDVDYLKTRFSANPTAALAAEMDGEVVGSNIAYSWGSVGIFGPLSVRPDLWNRGIGQHLVEAAIARLAEAGTQQVGLFTFANSPKHLALYQKFGLYPRFLTFLLTKPIQSIAKFLPGYKYSELTQKRQEVCLKDCFELTDSLYPGLDLSREIVAVSEQNLGDTVLLEDETSLAGFAVCHCGAGSEAGSEVCYIKFGAVRSGQGAGERFERLLKLCEVYGETQKMSRLSAGVNSSHNEAYTRLLDRGFRAEVIGVAMHKNNEPLYHRPDVFVLDDWR